MSSRNSTKKCRQSYECESRSDIRKLAQNCTSLEASVISKRIFSNITSTEL